MNESIDLCFLMFVYTYISHMLALHYHVNVISGPGLFLMYLVLGFFALITAYFSVVEQKRIVHRDNRRAVQRRKHVPGVDEICFDFEEITREQALFRILGWYMFMCIYIYIVSYNFIPLNSYLPNYLLS